MIRRTILEIALTLLLVAAALLGLTPTASGDSEQSYLVDFGAPVPSFAGALIARAGGSMKTALPEIGVVVATSRDQQFASRIRAVAGVQSAVVDRVVNWLSPADQSLQSATVGRTARGLRPDSLYISSGWNIKRVGGGPAEAWALETGRHAVVVAVMDTGVYAAHPDLALNYLYGRSYVPGESADDLNGHGTFVAGIVAGSLGGGAIVGVGPGLGLASYKVLNAQGAGRWSWLLAAIYQAAADGVKVANMSLAAPIDVTTRDGQVVWQLFQRAATYASQHGVLLVAAAANGGADLRGAAAAQYKLLPVELSGVIGVSATTRLDQAASYSNYGSGIVDLAAPGGDLGPGYSSTPDPSYLITSSASPRALGGALYGRGAGTSFAAPHVSAAAGLVASRRPELNPAQLAVVLQQTAEDLGAPGHDALFGFGLVNAQRALLGR